MNTSVSSLAPKGKTYSMTYSLLTRVSIAAGTSIEGHEQFWKNVSSELDFTFDDHFISMLRSRDTKKKEGRIVQSSKEGKVRRNQVKYEKTNNACKTQRDAYKEGMFYESGVAISLAKKTVKTVPRNSKDTPNDQWRCSYYHPLYCTTLGHKDCRSLQYGMKKKSKEERAAALKVILDE